MFVLGHQFAVRFSLSCNVSFHALLVEYAFATGSDFGDSLHGFERRGNVVAVVADGDIAARGKVEGAVNDHFFTGGFAEGFGPFEFAGVTLHFELEGV